jgi:MoaA/NifB/PqqE/SkfB family radical SAM enzyme
MSRKRFEKVYVEISNICNLQCGFCPEVERGKDVMGPELFRRVIADAAPLAEQVCLHLMGEPLAHPRFAEYVSVCAEHALPVNVTTNGTLLDEARAEALLHPVVRQVNFSVQSFASNFPGQDIGPYLGKIFAFTRLAFERRPDLYVNYRLWNLTAADEESNAAIVARVEKEFDVPLPARVDVRWRKGRHVLNRLYLHFDSRFEWPSLAAPRQSDAGTCRALSSHLGILSDGTVVPCCLDKEGVTPLGDARRQTLGEILAGERAQRMARGFKEGRLVEELCRHCTFISRFDRQASRLAADAAASSLIS